MTIEHMIETHRGKPDEQQLNALTGDGWRVVAAYATQEGVSTIWHHHFVLMRTIGGDGEPVIEPLKITVAAGVGAAKLTGKIKGKGK